MDTPREKYMVIDPDGSTRWIEIERSNMLQEFYQAIGTNFLENVCTIFPDVCLIVDELGKIKNPPQPHNDVASDFYRGWIMADDDIVGPAIVAAIHLVDGVSDWVPLNQQEQEIVEGHMAFCALVKGSVLMQDG